MIFTLQGSFTVWGQKNKYSDEVLFAGAASPSAAQPCTGQNCKQPAGQTTGRMFEMDSRTWVSSVLRTFWWSRHAQHEMLTNLDVWASDLLSRCISFTGAPSNFSCSISVMLCCSCCIYFGGFHPIYKKIHCLLTLRGVFFFNLPQTHAGTAAIPPHSSKLIDKGFLSRSTAKTHWYVHCSCHCLNLHTLQRKCKSNQAYTVPKSTTPCWTEGRNIHHFTDGSRCVFKTAMFQGAKIYMLKFTAKPGGSKNHQCVRIKRWTSQRNTWSCGFTV